MKILKYFSTLFGASLLSFSVLAAQDKPAHIVLPEPSYDTGKPFMQVLKERKTTREFGPRTISDQNMGEILWAAVGINRPDGKRTIPTSRDSQDLDVYVLRQGGAYRYNPRTHYLDLVNPAMLTYTAARQEFVKQADALLVYVSNNPNREVGSMHAGSAYQNVGLYAANVGMNNVVIRMVDMETLHKELHLNDDEYVIVTQALGWPKKNK